MTTIIDYAALPALATDPRSHQICETIASQISPMTKMANGWTAHFAIESGALCSFKLSGPYGQRFITVTLNAWDTYDVTCYRVGKGGKVIVTGGSTMVYADQLNEMIFFLIDKSCD
jgi:hypothetical protein